MSDLATIGYLLSHLGCLLVGLGAGDYAVTSQGDRALPAFLVGAASLLLGCYLFGWH
jgi:hypothetical protein